MVATGQGAVDGLGWGARLRPDNGLRRGQVVEIQRARILAAMVEVSAERGVANATVAHIVERAGVSRRTFYELYRDREDCFLGAFDDALARASCYVLDGYDPEASWLERIRSALTGLLAFLDMEREAGRLLVVGSLGAGSRVLEHRRYVLSKMIALVGEGQAAAKARPDLPSLTAEGIVGGVLSVLHARLLVPTEVLGPDVPPTLRDPDNDGLALDSLLALTAPIMSMIVLPYLGPAAARHQLVRPAPAPPNKSKTMPVDPLRNVQMRLTYRTVRALSAVAACPGCSNREVGLAAGIQDQGQISKLLTRLSRLGLVENSPTGIARGAPNAWVLTGKGAEIEQVLCEGSTV